ncbi:carboxypeptidase-like regulatory domain-containing protein [Polaribacter filamentus]|uniref:carboxypeptidase-like regulatory domain-containing protein n=1 Tax=Polaribacter filamentus TaxID=53483 RepID=UPI000CF1EFF5|nr:carboxypeptidase-like regulatory domain-containing protein [Polaribacter filamentus]
MKILYKSLFFSCLLFSLTSYSQIKGKCIDESGKGISYVNISVKGKSIGTVSNMKGNFSFESLSVKKNDSLIFSHLNFEKKTIGIPLKINKIQLESKVENLEEIVISNKKRRFKEKTVGTKTKSGNVVLSFTSKSLGTEVGKIIKVRKNKVYDLKTFNLILMNWGINLQLLESIFIIFQIIKLIY